MNLSDYGLIPFVSKTVPIDRRFGRLVVIATGRPRENFRYTAVCQCDCGSEPKAIRLDGLTSGNVVSCGCFQKEQSSTHGLTNHPLYSRHHLMMSRCYSADDPAFPNYGGRGIIVCDRWHDVSVFIHDLEPMFSPGLEMDRIDNNGPYEPSNVRFVTRQQNSDNRRTGRLITYNNKTQSLRAWSKELGISYQTLWTRIDVWEWDTERAFSTPPLNDKERMAKARAVRWNSS